MRSYYWWRSSSDVETMVTNLPLLSPTNEQFFLRWKVIQNWKSALKVSPYVVCDRLFSM